jgi:hypothetical protein
MIGIDTVGDIFGFVNAVTTASGAPAVLVPARSATDLTQALHTVLEAAAACMYTLPDTVPVESLAHAYLQHRGSDGSVTSVAVRSAALDCDASAGGVYLDPALPGLLRACPTSCPALDAPGELELLTHCVAQP